MGTFRVSLGGRRNVSVSPEGLAAGGGMLLPASKQVSTLIANGSGSMTAWGDVAVVTATTVTNVVATAAVPWQLTGLATAATLNTTGLATGGTRHLWAQNPSFFASVSPQSPITVVRYWVGLFNTAWGTLLGVDLPGSGGSALSGAGFRFSTAVPDTTWKCVTSNGAADTVVDSGVAVAAGTAYKMEIADNGASTIFKINGAVVATISTTRPATTAVVRQGAGVQTLEAVIKGINVNTLATVLDV